jgi:serine-type D-Ala-D-Ala carboxypeptidase/endopeptidase (penicillin-binding protein 4)
MSSKMLARDRRQKIFRWVRIVARTVLALLPIALVMYGVREYKVSKRADPPKPQKAGAVGPRLGTPLFAVRRVPTLLSAPLTTSVIKQKMASIAAQVPAGSCLGAIADGQVVGAANPELAVIPASTMKVVTAAVALDKLGSDYRFTTNVYGTLVDGRVTSDLVMVGGGDPMLATPKFREASKGFPYYVDTPFTKLEDIVALLRKKGVRVLNGGLVGDGTRYEGDGILASWPKSQVSPIGGLVVNDTRTRYDDETYGTDPAKHAVEQLGAIMKDRIVTNGAEGKSGALPEGLELLASVQSAPLKDIVAAMLTRSENSISEMLFREIGKKVAGSGSFSSSAQAVTDTLASWGVPMAGVVIHDGSGLDRADHLTCQALISVLSHGGPGSDLAAGLATPGKGTLAGKFVSSAIKDRLRAKTGTLTGVRSLAGFVSSSADHSVTFALILNVSDAETRADKLWNVLADALASFPQPIDLTPFTPRPPASG